MSRSDESSPLRAEDPECQDDDQHLQDATNVTSRRSAVVPLWKSCARWTMGGTVTLLITSNIVLFIQLQAVTLQVASNKNQIHQLQAGMAQQKEQTDTISDKVEQERSLTIIHMAGTFVLLTCLVTLFHMMTHLRKFNQPDIQRKILSILWMAPIYGLTSFVSLCFPSTDEYMMVLKDFYEAYCIYQFLAFLIAVLGQGNRETVIEILSKHANHLAMPYRCLSCFYYPPPSESDYAKSKAVLLETQILALQFVIVKPVTSIVIFVLNLMDNYDGRGDENTNGSEPLLDWLLSVQFWLLVVQNLSVFFAFAGLLKFYHSVADDLQWMHPRNKFLSVKGIVFMTFWQSMAIALLIHFQRSEDKNSFDGSKETDDQELTAMLQNILICLEMLIFSLAHFCVFPADEWEPDYVPIKMARPGMAFQDFARDVSLVIDHTTEGVRSRRIKQGSPRSMTEDEETGNTIASSSVFEDMGNLQ